LGATCRSHSLPPKRVVAVVDLSEEKVKAVVAEMPGGP
jgi:hypothetical protein